MSGGAKRRISFDLELGITATKEHEVAMTEREYIDATNLCKARLAAQVMRDYMGMGSKYDKHADAARKAIAKLCEALEKRVATIE